MTSETTIEPRTRVWECDGCGAKVKGHYCMSPWGWRIVLSGYYCSDRCWIKNGN